MVVDTVRNIFPMKSMYMSVTLYTYLCTCFKDRVPPTAAVTIRGIILVEDLLFARLCLILFLHYSIFSVCQSQTTKLEHGGRMRTSTTSYK